MKDADDWVEIECCSGKGHLMIFRLPGSSDTMDFKPDLIDYLSLNPVNLANALFRLPSLPWLN